MDKFTDEQNKIIYPDKWNSSMIIAKAGSGKTTTIIARAINQIESTNTSKNIAIISFTNKSAEDIYKKIKNKNATNNIVTATFHLFLLRNILSFLPLFRAKRLVFNFRKKVETLEEWVSCIKEYNEIPGCKDSERDFLLEYSLNIVQCNNYVRRYLKCKFLAIYIDEAQDNNEIQYEIIKNLLEIGVQIVLIGDDKQTIYKFRGANAKKFLEMKDNPYFRDNIYFLTKNFRCHPIIDNCANQYRIPESNLLDQNGNGIFIDRIDNIRKIIEKHKDLGEGMCFLFRGFNGKQYARNINITSKYELPIIKLPDVISNMVDYSSIDLLFRMFFGNVKDELVFIDKMMPNIPYSLSKEIVRKFNKNPTEDNFNELNEYCMAYNQVSYSEILPLFYNDDVKNFYTLDLNSNFSMTIHASKGLEFKNVILMKHDFYNLTEDERNLFYVACTRAKNKLYFLSE